MNSSAPKHDMHYDRPTDYNRPDRQILSGQNIDDLAVAMITMTRELCVLADRVKLLEHVLIRHGIDAVAEIERMVPDAELQKQLDAQALEITRPVIDAMRGV